MSSAAGKEEDDAPSLTVSSAPLLADEDSEDDNISENGMVQSGSGSSAGGTSPRYHLTNMIVMSLCFFFTFTAFTALQNLQASLNKTGKTGLAVLYGLMIVSSFITPPIVQRLSPKVTMVIGLTVHCIFTGANFYPVEYALVPACGLLGLASAPLWTAQQTYLTSSAHMHAQRAGLVVDEVVNRFNGIFFLIFQGTQIGGNLIASLVLRHGEGRAEVSATENAYCNLSSSGNDTLVVTNSVRYTLLSVYLACNVAGALLCLFAVRPLLKSVSKYVAQGWKDTCLATVRRMVDPYMLLLIPILLYGGLAKAYFFGEFTKHYISECNGIGWVGYVMLVLGVVNASSSWLCSRLAERIGRLPIVLTGTLLNGGLIAFLLIWVRVPNLLVVFLVAGLWGFVDAIGNTQLSTLLGVLFSHDQEAAFANFRMWQALGFCLTFASGDVIDMDVKLWILLALMAVSAVLYVLAEMKYRAAKRKGCFTIGIELKAVDSADGIG